MRDRLYFHERQLDNKKYVLNHDQHSNFVDVIVVNLRLDRTGRDMPHLCSYVQQKVT